MILGLFLAGWAVCSSYFIYQGEILFEYRVRLSFPESSLLQDSERTNASTTEINKSGGWKCALRVDFFFKIMFIREMRIHKQNDLDRPKSLWNHRRTRHVLFELT